MISIIISSYQSHFFSAVEINIAETCGVPYEIIKIENPGIMGICAAYVHNEIEGYHGYDLIFSLEAAKNYTNYVTDQILIKHFSSGSLSKEWLASIIKVRKLIGRFEYQKTDRNIELENYRKLIYSLRKMGYTKKESLLTVLPYINPIKHGFTNTLKMIYRLKFLLS